jgi:lipoprotein Spr
MRLNLLCYICSIVFLSCHQPEPTYVINGTGGFEKFEKKEQNHNQILLAKPDSVGHVRYIATGKTAPAELLFFANSLKGTPYKYASTDPAVGLDCSGFIAYVFNHFNIAVPRSSIDFTFVHRSIRLNNAKPGDLILFTGTDSTIRKVGHMGIIVSNTGNEITFIHSTSGKAYGVTETPLNAYYMGRYMKTLRIFPQNDR